MKINEIKAGEKRISVEGKISDKLDVGEVKSNVGDVQKRAYATLCDETGSVQITLWREDAEKYNNGDCVKLENGYELTLLGKLSISAGFYGSLTKIEKNIECEDVESANSEFVKIKDIKSGMNPVYTQGKISGKTQIGEVNNPSGGVQKRANATLCDETGSVRITLWKEDAEKYNNGDCVKLENGFSNTVAGVTNVTAGYYGSLTLIEKNIECEDESTSNVKLKKINEIEVGEKAITVEGKISDKSDVGDNKSNSGVIQKRAHATLCDETGSVRITLWREDADNYQNGDCIRIDNGYSTIAAGEHFVTAGYYGSLTKIEKNIECKDESTTFDKNKETTI